MKKTNSKKTSLVLATNNKHKIKEIVAVLRRAKIRLPILTLDDFPKRRPVVENRRTIEGNAIKKAKEVAKATGHWALADDTGLFISALKGRPGVYSARFAGPGCTFEDNNKKVLKLMKKVPWPKRTAAFRCIAALADPSGRAACAEGRISGKIDLEIRGKTGFGYDPVFYVPKFKKTFAEMSSHQKNDISHRGKAFRQVASLIKRLKSEK